MHDKALVILTEDLITLTKDCLYTVKPLDSGHNLDLKILSVVEKCLMHRGFFPKLACFVSKTCFRVLGYRALEPNVCQEAGVEIR